MLFVPWVRFTQDNYTPVCICRLYISLEKCDTLVIPHQDQGTSYRSQHICEVTLEETFHPFVPSNLLPTVPGSLVHLLLLSTHHHKSPPNGVEGVCNCDRPSCNCLCYGKSDENAGLVSSKLLGSVISTKIDGSVDDDPLHRGDEPGVQPLHHTIGLEAFDDTVSQTFKLSLSSTFANIRTKSSSCKVQRIDNSETSSASSSSTCEIGSKEFPELIRSYSRHEDGLVLVFKSKVKSLSWEVSDDINNIPTPEGEESLFLVNSSKAVNYPFISLVSSNTLVSILNLKQHFHSFQRGHHSFTDSSGDAPSNKVKHKILTHDAGLGFSCRSESSNI